MAFLYTINHNELMVNLSNTIIESKNVLIAYSVTQILISIP